MATKYTVTTRTRLNADGVYGTWMFVLSPAIQLLAWLWLEPGIIRLIVVILAGMAFLGGFVFLLIGRTQTSRIDEA